MEYGGRKNDVGESYCVIGLLITQKDSIWYLKELNLGFPTFQFQPNNN